MVPRNLKPKRSRGRTCNAACEFRGTPKAEQFVTLQGSPNYQHNLSSAALKKCAQNKTEVESHGLVCHAQHTYCESTRGELVLQRMRPLDAAIRHSTPHVQAGRGRARTDKLAAGHVSSLASDIRWMDHELDYFFAHAHS
jgi:hypothetical protein